MSQDLRLTLRLNADGTGLRGELRKASGEVVQFSDQLEGGAKKGTKALRETEQQADRLGNTTQQLTRRVAALAAGYVSLQTLTGLGRMADQYTNLNAQIRLVTNSAGEQVMVFDEIEEIAGRTGQAMDTVTRLATRTIRALVSSGEEAAAATEKGLALTDAISNAVLVSGAGSAEANAAIVQLSQGLASGVLRGEEFNSVMEQTPRVAQALANALDMTLGELRELAMQGGLTTEIVTEALLSQAEVLEREAATIPPTIGRAWQALSNAVTIYVGEADEGIGASRAVAETMVEVAENLDRVVESAQTLAILLAGRLTASLITSQKAAAVAEWIRYQRALASMAGVSRTAAASQLALAAASRAAAGALALVGGPVGALTLGASALVAGLLDVRRELSALKEPSNEAEDALRSLRQIAAEGWQSDQISEVQKKLTDLREELLEVSRARASAEGRMERSGGGLLGRFLRSLQEEGTEELRLNEELLQEQIRMAEHLAGIRHHEDIANGLALVESAGEATVDVLERLGIVSRNAAGGIGEMAPASEKFTDGLDEQLNKLEEQLIALRDGEQALLDHQEAQALAAAAELDAKNETTAYTEAVREHWQERRRLIDAINDEQEAKEASAQADIDARKNAQEIKSLAGTYRQLLSATNPLAAQQLELNEQLAGMQQLAALGGDELAEMDINSQQLAQVIAHLREQIDGLDADPFANLSQEVQDILDWVDQMDMDPLIRDINTLEDALADATDPEVVERLQDAIGRLRQELGGAGLDVGAMMMAYAEGTGQALRSIQQLTKVGSKEYQAIEIAIAAANLQAAIGAILNQGMGDPYTAPIRMAAMASAVAGLVGSIQGFGGGFDTTAQDRQERQGTGSVLGDSEAKSESILNAAETTAKAVSQLPGINRGMARNLQRLADGIAGASGMLARGAGDSEFTFGTDFAKYENAHNWGAMGEIWKGVEFALDPLGLFGGLFDWVGELFGGSSKVVDEGVAILGGTMGELIDEVMVQAFQEVKYKKWVFGSSKRETAFGEIDDDVARQFQLIFESIADAVASGAEALGLSREEIEAAIRQFEVEAQEISLKDLTAEEQQAELEAVFSKIFDGLAGHVVDFLPQFQKVGEGLADTLIRVATGVQVTEEAMRRFGWAVDQTDPEKFAQISEGLIGLLGGLDPYMAGITEFFDRFAPAADKMEMAQSELTGALEQVGLKLPETAEGMWELMRSLDPATEAGREQIAMLLELRQAADEYYSHLEAIESERMGLRRQILELMGNTAALRRLELEELDASNRGLQERIWALQREAELVNLMAGVSEDIANVSLSPLRREYRELELAHRELYARAKELGASEKQLAEIRMSHDLQLQRLSASLEESISSIWEQMRGDGSQAESAWGDEFSSPVQDAAANLRDALIRALEGVEDWLERSKIDDPSLTGRQRFRALESEFERLVDIALTGSGQERVDAIDRLPGIASELEALGVQMHGSATEPFQELRDRIVSAMEEVMGIEVPGGEDPVTGSQVGQIGGSVDQMASEQRDLTALAGRLLEELGVLVEISGKTAPDLAAALGVPLSTVIKNLIGEVEAGSIETVEQLVAVANTLGMDLAELADEISYSIGDLRDQESLLSESLQNAVMRMPPEIQSKLWGPLNNIWKATSDADANEALADLIAETEGLPVQYKNALAPFFEEIDTQDLMLEELGLLDTIRKASQNAAYTLAEIHKAIKGSIGQEPPDSPLPSEPAPPLYAAGGWASGVIMTGDGGGPELVLPHDVSTFFQRVGVPVNAGGGTDPRIAEYLQRLVALEEQAARQRDQIADRQIVTVDRLSDSVMEAARLEASNAGMFR